MKPWRRRELLLGALAAAVPLAARSRTETQRGPAPLKPGARIAALAPGTWLEREDPTLELLRRRCRQEGWRLLTPPELRGQWRWFSGTDEQRASSLRQAWLDPSIDALFWSGRAGAVHACSSRAGPSRPPHAGVLGFQIAQLCSSPNSPQAVAVGCMAGLADRTFSGNACLLCSRGGLWHPFRAGGYGLASRAEHWW